MFPLSINTYIMAILAILALAGLGYGNHEHKQYVNYVQQVQDTVDKQKAAVESITKQQAIVTKGIQDEYDAKLNAIRSYYKSTSMWNNNGGSSVSGISAAPKSADVIASYNELVGRCAETTVQLVELQKWINEQIGIK